MGRSPEPPASDADDEIMRATYRALCDHGYADLTIKRIADEYGKSTAAIHYHFDTKDELLAAFLEFLLDEYVDALHDVEATDPRERLDLLLDKLLVDPQDHRDLLVALLEMRNQTPHKAAFSEQFKQNDEYVRYLLRTVIEDGVSRGVFRTVDGDHVARTLMTIVDGARMRAVVLDEDDALAAARESADEYVSAILLPE